MILERLHFFLKSKNLSFNRFEKTIDVSHGSLSSAFKHNKNVGSNVLEKILLKYPELSAEWLLRGKGEMLLANRNLEETILQIWDDKYGQEFKSMKHQLAIFFNDKMDRERKVDDKSKKSDAS